MIRALVVDDEPLSLSNLVLLLGRDAEIDIVGECRSGLEALTEIRRTAPDAVFLDVEMPECDGFDVVEMLGGDVPRALVFVTAYDRYAVRAFEAGALDYLLKPFDDERFHRTLDRMKRRLRESATSVRQGLAIKSGRGLRLVPFGEIDWIEAADYHSRIHAGSVVHVIRRSMNDLERELDPARFCRIHRSAIVNLERVRALKPSEFGEYDVELGDGSLLPLSRRYRKNLRAWLERG